MKNTAEMKLVSIDEAREYLMQAHAIFEQRGMVRQLRETKQKIKLLSQSAKQAHNNFVQDEINGLHQEDREDQDGGGGMVDLGGKAGSAAQLNSDDQSDEDLENRNMKDSSNAQLTSGDTPLVSAIYTNQSNKKVGVPSKKGSKKTKKAKKGYTLSSATANILKNNFLK